MSKRPPDALAHRTLKYQPSLRRRPRAHVLNQPRDVASTCVPNLRSAAMRTYLLLALSLTAVSPATCQLDKWAKAAGLSYFGTAVDNPSLGNQGYMRIARDADEFGSITPANGQKWSNTQGSQGWFSYSSGDAIANVAKQSGQLLRCHTLVWHNQLPGWGESSREPHRVPGTDELAASSQQRLQSGPDAAHHHISHPKRRRPLQGTLLRLGCRQ